MNFAVIFKLYTPILERVELEIVRTLVPALKEKTVESIAELSLFVTEYTIDI